MTVSLNIENDAELRAYIKDCIRGQVTAITREEISQIVKDSLASKLKGWAADKQDKLFNSAMRDSIERVLRQDHNVGSWSLDYIKPFVQEVLVQSLNSPRWEEVVKEMAKAQVDKLLKSAIQIAAKE